MKRLLHFLPVLVLIVMLSVVFIPPTLAVSYAMPQAWQIVYLGADGSLDVYDYREYIFDNGPPTDTLPYHLNTEYALYHRTLSYPVFEAYTTRQSLDGIVKPTDIKERWNTLRGYLQKLQVEGTGGNFDIHVPHTNHLFILVHYKVSPDITVIGKDFARTYYKLPTLGKSDVSVDTYYTAFILPTPVQCNNAPTYDQDDTSCPCFMVHRFLPQGGPIGRYDKGCDFVLFTVSHLPVTTEQELDSVYPPSVLTQADRGKLSVNETYDEVKQWQEAHSATPEDTLRYMWWSLFASIFALIIGGIAGGRKKAAYKKYYLHQLKHAPHSMELPSDDIYRSFFFTTDELYTALDGNDPYDIPSKFSDETSPSLVKRYIEKGGNAFRAIFFSLMQKGYIIPITDGDKLLGFKIEDANTPLEEHEKLVLQTVKEAAKTDVKEKHGLISKIFGKREDLATVMNERDPEHILLPQEFEAYLKKDMYSVYLGNDVYASIPAVAQLGLDLITSLLSTRDIPPVFAQQIPQDAPSSIKMWDKIRKFMLMLGVGLMLAAGGYFFISVAFSHLLTILPHPSLWNAIPALLAVVFLIIGFFMKGTMPMTWLNPAWFSELLAWYKVEKWIKAFTRIAKKNISAYETLNWDHYYIFAALRGIEQLLMKALKVSGIIKKYDRWEDAYRNWLVADYMYRSSWWSASRSFTSHYESMYHKATSSGSSSSGSSTGSSFGGGGGGGGGSTGW